MKRLSRPSFQFFVKDWRIVAIFTVSLAVELAVGMINLQTATYRSPAHIFAEFMNGPLRLLFPVIVALVVGPSLSAQLSDRFVAFTRTRQSIRRQLVKEFWKSARKTIVGFVLVTLIIAFVSFVVVPAVWPRLIDPHGYGTTLDSSTATTFDYDTAPLTALTKYGWPIFALATAAWASSQAFLFAIITFCAVVLVRKPVLALSIPFLVYIFQSAVYQVVGMPAQSFLVSTLYPTGLSHFDLAAAAIAGLYAGLFSVVVYGLILYRAPVNPRFS